MKQVAKYNTFKGLSLFFTFIPTLLVTLSFSDVIVHDSGASISLVGIIGVLLAILFLKDKIAENFKAPSPFIVASVLFVIILLIEQIIIPVKYTCLTVMFVCGLDELLFKRIYKRIELLMPDKHEAYKHLGFYMCKTETLTGESLNE